MQFISLCWIDRAVVQSRASMFVRFRASILRKMMQAFLANLGTEFARNERKNRSKLKKKHEKSIVWTANRPKDKPPSTVSQSTKMASAFKPSFVCLRRPPSTFLIESLGWPERVHSCSSPIARSLDRSVARSLGPSAARSINRPPDRSFDRPIARSFDRATARLIAGSLA